MSQKKSSKYVEKQGKRGLGDWVSCKAATGTSEGDNVCKQLGRAWHRVNLIVGRPGSSQTFFIKVIWFLTGVHHPPLEAVPLSSYSLSLETARCQVPPVKKPVAFLN